MEIILKKDDYKGWAKGLRKAGYATDPKYAQKIQSVLNNPAFADKAI